MVSPEDSQRQRNGENALLVESSIWLGIRSLTVAARNGISI